MKKVIPEVTEVYCDRCNENCTGSNRRMTLVIHQRTITVMQDWCAVPHTNVDLCDCCAKLFLDFMENGD